MKVQLFGLRGKFGHALYGASRVAAYEIWYELLFKVVFAVYPVENPFKIVELLERRLAHKAQHRVIGMFRRNLQTSAHVIAYEFLGIPVACFVALLVATPVQQHIISHSTAYKTLLYLRQGINRSV